MDDSIDIILDSVKEYNEIYYYTDVPAHLIDKCDGLILPDRKIEYEFDGKDYVCNYFSNEKLNKLNPNNINNKMFWSMVDIFNFVPVCGGNPTVKNAKDVNKATSGLFRNLFDSHLEIFKPNKNILEIGYGYGSFVEFMRSQSIDINEYYGIDLIKRFKKRYNKNIYNFYETDGWEIPTDIPNNLDLVFSFNVFQHLSNDQKINYLKKGYNLLKKGGYFTLSSFFTTKNLLKDHPNYWSFKDESETPYVKFFDQFIPVENLDEFINDARNIGYQVVQIFLLYQNTFQIILKK